MQLLRLLAVFVFALVAACSGTTSSTDGGGACATSPVDSASGCVRADGGGLDCCALCSDYCAKLDECGVSRSDTCLDDCTTLTQSGVSTQSYRCVVSSTCDQISACGI